MPQPVSFQAYNVTVPDTSERAAAGQGTSEASELGKKFEQMLWTEMLSYAGLDKAFAQDGGQAAETFSRYLIESIASDLAESHPMGLGEAVDRTVAASQSLQQDAAE
ncbi:MULTISPECIES: hypothetical protein [unclassified Hyphomonas]|uniref:hypothetical protein n=1 Tax=unclassified Hyphomonas TaxID=2630699 RepID=UPI0004589ED5|nr:MULTISPECIES: hypothetical protein [unclassified Hyphomonas]KCZ50169.1 hypothetical protein HY17_03395 [Hyphomonas sp. CY54-11-8]RAN39764.1 hypothetical protein HY26_15180 [Hyphomonas sp. GM-8P]